MGEDTKQAIQKTVDYLDEQMQSAPTQELANTSNYLQALLDGNG